MKSHLNQIGDLDCHIGKLASFLEHSNQCLQDKLYVFFTESFASFDFEVVLFQVTWELELLVYFQLALQGRIGLLLLFEYLL